MKLFVKVKPSAKEEKLETISENQVAIWVKEPPVEGRANEAVIRVLADHFRVPRLSVKIISGRTSKNKIIEIN